MIKKMIQIVNYLLKLNHYCLNYTKLIKLLYLADREALIKWDITITKDSYTSLDNGIVLSNLYDLIKDEGIHENQCLWNTYFITEGYNLKSIIKNNLPEDELSDREKGLLKEIFKKYKPYDWKYLAYTVHHNLPEWKDPHGSSIPLSVNEILEEIGRTQKEIQDIEKENQAYLEEVKLFNSG
ncbi:hypothetical protein ES705_25373 [subsurface metagenome]